MEYIKDREQLVAQLFLASTISTADLVGLENLSGKFNFKYNVVSDKEKVNRKSRNSLIEVFLVNNEK